MKKNSLNTSVIDEQTPAPAGGTGESSDIVIGKWRIPLMNIRVARLLERINSPFVVPRYDAEGKTIPITPTITDITNTLYIILNQRDPNLLSLISNEDTFEKSVLEMCGDINMQDMQKLSFEIQKSLSPGNTVEPSA